MNSNRPENRISEGFLFGIYNLSFLFLAAMAIWFHEERIFGSDASSYLFGVVNSEWFYTERGRLIIYVSQWFPLLAVWCGLSMKCVLIAHSLGHVLFFYFIFLIGHYYFKKTHVGGLMLLVQTVAVTEAYFAWPYGEVYYGVALTIFLILILEDSRPLNRYSAISIAFLSLFLISGHPLVFPCLFVGLAIHFTNKGCTRKTLSAFVAMLFVLVMRFLVVPSYDGELATAFFSEGIELIPTAQELIGLLKSYPVLWALSGIVLCALLFRKQLVATSVMLFGFLLVTLVIKRFAPLDSATQQYYQSYTGILAAVLLTTHVGGIAESRIKMVMAVAAVVASAVSIGDIYRFSHEVTIHVQKLKTMSDELIEEQGNRFVITGNDFYEDPELIWQSSEPFHEMLLLSSLGKKTILLRVFERAMEYHEWATTGHTPMEGPEAPRIKDKHYRDTPENRALISEWIHTVEPTLNRAYFTVDDRKTYKFIEN